MKSGRHWFLSFWRGLSIYNDRTLEDIAGVWKSAGIYSWPEETEGMQKFITDHNQNVLCLAGGENDKFKAVELEILVPICE